MSRISTYLNDDYPILNELARSRVMLIIAKGSVVTIEDGCDGYYRVQYDSDHLRVMSKELENLADEIDYKDSEHE